MTLDLVPCICIRVLHKYAAYLCMLICIFHTRTLITMRQLESGGDYGLGEDQLADNAPYVRALLVQRLEQIWSVCEPHVTGSVKPDPRFVEAGIRVLDRLARVFRLDQPASGGVDPGEVDPAVLRKAALDQIRELELRQGWD